MSAKFDYQEKPVHRPHHRGLPRLLLALLAALVAAAWLLPAAAQSLGDPTQPPPESRLQPLSAAEAAAAVPKGPQLQSVLLGTRGREVAVIDGQTLRRGDKFDGAVLVKVGKDSVTLRRGAKTEVLSLFPKK
jgi:MSHA biogenesis protein MshK